MRRLLLILALISGPVGAAQAQDGLSLATYLWLDDSGNPAAYRSISIDAGTLYLDMFSGADETNNDRPATEADTAALTQVLSAQLATISMAPREPPQVPYVTVEWGFSDVTGSVNVVQTFAPEALPAAIAALQTTYFGSVIGAN